MKNVIMFLFVFNGNIEFSQERKFDEYEVIYFVFFIFSHLLNGFLDEILLLIYFNIETVFHYSISMKE